MLCVDNGTDFECRGRAEITRLLLKNANYPFEDIRIKNEEWQEVVDITIFIVASFISGMATETV
jgi:hypothetical protein